MRVILANQQHAILTQKVGSGAAGTVWKDPFDPWGLIKVYHAGKGEPAAKLEEMVQNPPRCHNPQNPRIAWPSKPVFDGQGSGQIVGFAMPAFERVFPVAQFVNPRGRSKWITSAFLLRVARSAAEIMADLHAEDYVIGDINELNFLVDAAGNVYLIDSDGIRVVSNSGVVFPCRFGVYDYAAPERQGKPFDGDDRTVFEDRHAAAVLFYRLLRAGEHPFYCYYTGNGKRPGLHERIERGLYPDSGKHPEFQPPRGAPPFTDLPPGIQDLFLRTFDLGFQDPTARPALDEWVDELTNLDTARVRAIPPRVWIPPLRPQLPTQAAPPSLGWRPRLPALPPLHWPRVRIPTAAVWIALGVFLGVGGMRYGLPWWQSPEPSVASTAPAAAMFPPPAPGTSRSRKFFETAPQSSQSLPRPLPRKGPPRGAPHQPALWKAMSP